MNMTTTDESKVTADNKEGLNGEGQCYKVPLVRVLLKIGSRVREVKAVASQATRPQREVITMRPEIRSGSIANFK